MSVEMLTYAALGARLNISPQAARSLSRRLGLPRSLSDDGKALVSVDLAEIRHTPRPPRGRASSSALLAAKIEALTAEIARLETTAADHSETMAADHRADFERERERADRLAVELLQATAETTVPQEVTARLEALTAEIARLETMAADHRADFERERERADRLAVELLQATAETTVPQEVTVRLEALTAEIARLETMAADHRADFERERERADRLAVELLQATAETTAAQEVTARLEDEVAALRSGGQSGGSVNGQGQAGRRLGHLAASIVQADRKACR